MKRKKDTWRDKLASLLRDWAGKLDGRISLTYEPGHGLFITTIGAGGGGGGTAKPMPAQGGNGK